MGDMVRRGLHTTKDEIILWSEAKRNIDLLAMEDAASRLPFAPLVTRTPPREAQKSLQLAMQVHHLNYALCQPFESTPRSKGHNRDIITCNPDVRVRIHVHNLIIQILQIRNRNQSLITTCMYRNNIMNLQSRVDKRETLPAMHLLDNRRRICQCQHNTRTQLSMSSQPAHSSKTKANCRSVCPSWT